LLFTPAADVTLERTIQFIKGGYSHSFGQRFGKHKEVWQKGFTDHRIRDAADFERHREYIHGNPVVRRLAERAEYRYCSSYPGFKLDLWPAAARAD